MNKNKSPIILYICIAYILITLFFGLKPFNFNSANGVNWLKSEGGIQFNDFGIVYGPADSYNVGNTPLLNSIEAIAIEIWLTPREDARRGFSYIFSLYDDHQAEIFSLSQVKNFLNISQFQTSDEKGLTYNWCWLKNAFVKGQRRLLTVTSDKKDTTVYLDGRWIQKFENYTLISAIELKPTWRMVIGNDPTGKKAWTGKIHGLAVYNQHLSSAKAAEHFQKWQEGATLSLLKENEVIALYPMKEQKGIVIHDVLNNRFNLLIPEKFTILKKNFLKLYSSNLTLNDNNLRDLRINILGFIPLGYFLFLVFNFFSRPLKTSTWLLIILAILSGMSISFIIETLQVHLPDRHSSITDLISNTFGAILGIILALIYLKLKKRFAAD